MILSSTVCSAVDNVTFGYNLSIQVVHYSWFPITPTLFTTRSRPLVSYVGSSITITSYLRIPLNGLYGTKNSFFCIISNLTSDSIICALFQAVVCVLFRVIFCVVDCIISYLML